MKNFLGDHAPRPCCMVINMCPPMPNLKCLPLPMLAVILDHTELRILPRPAYIKSDATHAILVTKDYSSFVLTVVQIHIVCGTQSHTTLSATNIVAQEPCRWPWRPNAILRACFSFIQSHFCTSTCSIHAVHKCTCSFCTFSMQEQNLHDRVLTYFLHFPIWHPQKSVYLLKGKLQRSSMIGGVIGHVE